MKVSGYDRGLDILRRFVLLVTAAICFGYGTLVWIHMGVLIPAVYTPYILGSMALLLLVAITRLKPAHPTLKSLWGRPMCPICGVNRLGTYRNRCKVCEREVCYQCLHPNLKWLCLECGRCAICEDRPGYVLCKVCGRRVCLHCTGRKGTCAECLGEADMSKTAEAQLVVLWPKLDISQKAVHCLTEAIRSDLLSQDHVLWKGLDITSLGAEFRVGGAIPNCRVFITPSTRIIATVAHRKPSLSISRGTGTSSSFRKSR